MIDNHCHPFDLEPRPLDLHRVAIDLSEMSNAPAAVTATSLPPLWRELLRSRLAGRLGATVEELPAARAEAAEDYGSYVAGLLAEVGITDLVMDPSWPPGSVERLDELTGTSGCRVHPLLRLESVVDPLLERGAGFDEVVDRLDEALANAQRTGYRGLKSVIAYRSGLGVDPEVSEGSARASLLGEGSASHEAKPLRDYLLRRALRFAADHAMPLQLHTGFGDSDIRLAAARPLHLEPLLRTPEGSEAPIVLLHAGFPYQAEAAFLAAAHRNVHVDVSLVGVFAPTSLADCLLQLIGLAPPERVLVGTDAYGPPETYWFAATMLGEAWETAVPRLRDLGASSGWVEAARRAIFEGNARRLYRLADQSPSR